VSFVSLDLDIRSGFLAEVSTGVLHIKRQKLKQGSKGQANLGRSGGMVYRKSLNLKAAKDVISWILGGRIVRRELFMIIKFDVASSPVSLFKKLFSSQETSQSVSLNLVLFEYKYYSI